MKYEKNILLFYLVVPIIIIRNKLLNIIANNIIYYVMLSYTFFGPKLLLT